MQNWTLLADTVQGGWMRPCMRQARYAHGIHSGACPAQCGTRRQLEAEQLHSTRHALEHVPEWQGTCSSAPLSDGRHERIDRVGHYACAQVAMAAASSAAIV